MTIVRELTKGGRTDLLEIICLHCGKAFKIDEAGYADILKFAIARLSSNRTSVLNWQSKISEMKKSFAAKDSEIQELKARIDAAEVARKLAVSEALSVVDVSRRIGVSD